MCRGKGGGGVGVNSVQLQLLSVSLLAWACVCALQIHHVFVSRNVSSLLDTGLCSGQSLTAVAPVRFDSPHKRHDVVPQTSLSLVTNVLVKETHRPDDSRLRVMTRCCTSAKVTDIMDYEAAVSFSLENSSTQHDVVAGAIGGPVAPRLDRLIRRVPSNKTAAFGLALPLVLPCLPSPCLALSPSPAFDGFVSRNLRETEPAAEQHSTLRQTNPVNYSRMTYVRVAGSSSARWLFAGTAC